MPSFVLQRRPGRHGPCRRHCRSYRRSLRQHVGHAQAHQEPVQRRYGSSTGLPGRCWSPASCSGKTDRHTPKRQPAMQWSCTYCCCPRSAAPGILADVMENHPGKGGRDGKCQAAVPVAQHGDVVAPLLNRSSLRIVAGLAVCLIQDQLIRLADSAVRHGKYAFAPPGLLDTPATSYRLAAADVLGQLVAYPGVRRDFQTLSCQLTPHVCAVSPQHLHRQRPFVQDPVSIVELDEAPPVFGAAVSYKCRYP